MAMRPAYLIQASCATVLPVALLAADFSARLLDRYPSSSTLWMIQIEFFKPVSLIRTSDSFLNAIVSGPLALWCALALCCIWAFYACRLRLPISIASHVAVLAVAEMGYRWGVGVEGGGVTSLAGLGQSPGYDALLIGFLGLTAGLSLIVSHAVYLRSIWQDAR